MYIIFFTFNGNSPIHLILDFGILNFFYLTFAPCIKVHTQVHAL